MTKPKKLRTKRVQFSGPRVLAFAWVRPATWRQLERLTVIARRMGKPSDCEPGDIAGKILDLGVPLVAAEVRKRERLKRKS